VHLSARRELIRGTNLSCIAREGTLIQNMLTRHRGKRQTLLRDAIDREYGWRGLRGLQIQSKYSIDFMSAAGVSQYGRQQSHLPAIVETVESPNAISVTEVIFSYTPEFAHPDVSAASTIICKELITMRISILK
jgi:hypothetical protein